MQEDFRNSNKVLLSCCNTEVWFCIYDGNMVKKCMYRLFLFLLSFSSLNSQQFTNSICLVLDHCV